MDVLLTLPEDLALLKAELRQFVEDRIEPRSRAIEETDEIPPDLVKEAKGLGLFGLTIPEVYGGLGLTLTGKCVVEEELGRSNYGFATLIGNHTGISSMGIVEFGTEDQKGRYLPRMATGDLIGAFALTEAGAGSDPAELRTTALRRGDTWILTGEKLFITNAPEAGLFTVMARTNRGKGTRGISTFLVERDWRGVSVGSKEGKMGMRGGHTAALSFQDVEVPADNLLGAEGEGFIAALKILTRGRVTLAARCVGMAERLLEKSIAYAGQRMQFGRRIIEYQAIQFKLAAMARDVHAARLMTYHAAAALEEGRRGVKEAAMAKLFASEMVCRVADEAVQIHGGMGYMKELDVERYYRDARITRIYEGTSEIQHLIIARELTGQELGR